MLNVEFLSESSQKRAKKSSCLIRVKTKLTLLLQLVTLLRLKITFVLFSLAWIVGVVGVGVVGVVGVSSQILSTWIVHTLLIDVSI